MEQQKQDSLSNKNTHKQGIRITIAIVAGKIIGALVMHFYLRPSAGFDYNL